VTRAAFYVDGFNLYHSLRTQHPLATACKWLDVRALCQSFLMKTEKLVKVTHFTAFATWAPDKVRRHQRYVRALRHTGVEIVMGEFKWKERECQHCGGIIQTHEEKRTDVNIAARLIRDAYLDVYDSAFIMSGDSDLIPGIETVRELFPSKELVAVFPLNRVTNSVKDAVDRYMRTKVPRIQRCLFPMVIETEDGRNIECPEEWRTEKN